MRAIRHGSIVLALTAALALLSAWERPRAATAGCPVRPSAVLSSQLPADVCIADTFTGIATDYFDDYSWRAFVALVWPTEPGRRGVAAANGTVASPGPRVFETFKPLWEIFHSDGSAPAASFDTYDVIAASPCAADARAGDVIIGSASGIDDIGQAGIGALDPPIAAQNGRYVRTLTLFNQTGFDHILSNRYYLRRELPLVPSPRPERPVVEFPMGTVAIKSAWVDVTGFPASLVKRMYTRVAVVKNATGGGCAKKTMGLVGLHIAQKTPSRPQWIWSSFEQKDVVPPAWPDSPGAFVLHDGNLGSAMTAANPLPLAPLLPEPVRPFNVVRSAAFPILTDTDLTTFAYQHLLAGTPWQYYKLVVTQWPRVEGRQVDPIPASLDGSIANTFPGAGAFSAFTNVTMETFDQRGPQTGCMSCHNRTRMTTDFMWTLMDHAYPSRLAPAVPPARGGIGRHDPIH